MIKNYFRIALRNLWKHKALSLINLTGLVTGMAACLLILQYVSFELSFDRFHKDADRIYRITNDRFQQGKLVQHGTITYPTIAPTMQKDFGEIEAYTTITNPGTFKLQKDRRIYESKGVYADQHFLSLFTFPMIAGNSATALQMPYSLVLSESNAQKIFHVRPGDYIRLIGQTLLIDIDRRPYKITGIIKDFPETSHLQYRALMSYETLAEAWGPWVRDSWESSDMWHYVKLKPGVEPDALEKKFPAFSKRYFKGYQVSGSMEEFFLQPLTKAHLFSDYEYEIGNVNNGKAVLTMLVIAAFILIIAWINYINLATARSLERAKEVGVRKMAGATAPQLIWQFLSESITINIMALTLALAVTALAQPLLNRLIEKPLSLALLAGQGYGRSMLLIVLLGTFLAGMLLSGFYPAFALSGFRAISVLKGNFRRTAKGIWVRQSLVVFQYTASMVLIVGTFFVFRQLQFMRNEKLGFNMDQMLVMRGPELTTFDSTSIERIGAFKAELLRHPSVQAASSSGNIFGNRLARSFNVRKTGESSDKGVTFSRMPVDLDFFKTYKIPLLAGRNFLTTDSHTNGDLVTNAILNLSAVKLLGFDNAASAVGQKFFLNNRNWEIVGVVGDFHQQSLRHSIEPIFFAPFYTNAGFYSVKVNAKNMEETIAQVRQTYHDFFPGNDFSYFFMNDKFNEQYRSDQIFGQVSGFFSILAVVIASLGIFGLSSYAISQRTKEIGVRKVLGATVTSIVALLSQDFIKLVLISIFIGAPLAWYAISHWLSDFAYKVDLEWWVFVLAGVVAIVIAIATVSSQAVRAALTNPSKSLRSE